MAFPSQMIYGSAVIYDDQVLGVGSYGKVCKAKYGQLPCAAKLLHDTMFESSDPVIFKFAERFEQECQFLSMVKHPNIVQYLGTYRIPKSQRLVLLLELMDESLTRFLERSNDSLSYHIQLNICHDVALALSYLHSNAIVHRDLSSNNVLLVGEGSKAKVTDFGVSKLVDMNPRKNSLTVCPGAAVYMPPEALTTPPHYSSKLDCFSYGVLTIQVLTRNFPMPGDAHQSVLDPNYPTGEILIKVPETERRKTDIDLIEPNHPLLPLALRCLHNRATERLSADEVYKRLATLKRGERYTHSVEQARGQGSLVQTLQRQLVQKDVLLQQAPGGKSVSLLLHNLQRQRARAAEGERRCKDAESRAAEGERRLKEAEGRLKEAESRAAEGERRLKEAESRAAEGERRLKEAENRAAEGERRLREAEGRAAETERRLKEERDRAEGRTIAAEREKALSEESLRECEEKLQRLETQWVVEKREVQLTGPELGRGGWATVSVATFRGVRVAAKCIHNQIISDYNIHLFKREMNMAARIRHPNLLQFVGATRRGELIILTELMPTSLRRELESRQGRHLMSLQQVTSIGLDVAKALNYLHLMQPHPLLHRDISSANVLLQPLPNNCWRAKVSDYGTVNLFQELQTANPGNPSYSAPEAGDFTKQSPKMDIFSFGVLLLEMLTGEFPDSDNRARQLRKISHQPLLALIQRCLSKVRDNRPSASDIIRDLDS